MGKENVSKVAVLNFSGNVGKSTLARHLLQPRMDNCPIMFIETINVGGNSTNINGKDFANAMVEVMVADRVIVDIGSSNIEAVFNKAARLGDILNDFDFFLIPTVPKDKQQADTINVIGALMELGIDKSKIKVVLNFAAEDSNIEHSFKDVFEFARNFGITIAVVHENEGYAYMKTRSVNDCIAPDRDLKREMQEATDPETKRVLGTARMVSGLATGIKKELDKAFTTLFRT